MQGATQVEDEELLTVIEVARAAPGGRVDRSRNEIPYLALPGGDYRVPRTELFRGLRGNVDALEVMRRLTERLRAQPGTAIDTEIAAARATRAQRR